MSVMIQRRLRIGIEVDGVLQIYESGPGQQYGASLRGKKTSDVTKNTFQVSIANLDVPTRNYLLDLTSVFGDRRSRNRVIVEAATNDTEYNTVMSGYIVGASVSQPPDITLTLDVQTGAYEALDVAVIGYEQPNVELRTIAQDAAAILERSLVFEATDRLVRNWVHSGSKMDIVAKLDAMPGIDAFIDDDRLVVKDTGTAIRERTTTLSQYSGMLGQPEVTEHGCKVRCTFVPDLRIGSLFTLNSVLNASMNGEYEIFELEYDLTVRGSQWHIVINAKRMGLNNKRSTPLESATRDTDAMQAREGGTLGLMRTLVPTSTPAASTNPASAMLSVIKKQQTKVKTQMPAMVISYDRQRNVARVRGLLMDLTSDGGSVPQAPIAEVPVLALGGGDTCITFPLKAGDLGWIEASQGDIANFMDSLGEAPVSTTRVHDWGDSRFIPDVFRNFTLPDASDDSLCIQSLDGSTHISLTQGLVQVVSDDAVQVDASTVTVRADTLNIEAVTAIKGNVDIQGTLTINGVNFNTHYHLYDGNKKTSNPR